MADWFVDKSIVGGNGTDPASAFASVLSITWSPGDLAWVRKTHTEQLTNSQFLGCGSPSSPGTNQWFRVIGWPSSGDLFYATRPARGVTVGWDSDVASSVPHDVFGYNWPTIVGSSNSAVVGILAGYQTGIYNFAFHNVAAGGGAAPLYTGLGDIRDHVLDNVFISIGSDGGGGPFGANVFNAMIGRLIICGSTTTNVKMINGAANIRQLEIHSRAMIGGAASGIVDCQATCDIANIINWSNSISYLFSTNNTNHRETGWAPPPIGHIGRITGVRPYSGYHAAEGNFTSDLRVDDYFGEGPIVFGGGLTRVLSSGEAQHNALSAIQFSVQSHTAGTNFQYNDGRQRWPNVRKFFNVTSGTTLTICVPVYVDSTAVFSLFSGLVRGYMPLLGWQGSACNSGNTIAGSYTNWTGSLIGGGSAWLWTNTFTPKETGTFPFDLHFGAWLTANSGDRISGSVIFGEPYSV